MEVGVWKAHSCRSKEFIENNFEVELIEPHPKAFATLKLEFGNRSNVKLHNIAIGDEKKEIEFVDYGEGSFISSLDNPPVKQDDPTHLWKNPNFDLSHPRFNAKCDIFDDYDKGDIDLLLLDMEGFEWSVISKLKSRPKIISVETHHENRSSNPNLNKIHTWMNNNTYKTLFKNTSDTFFIHGADLGWGNGGNDNWKA
jgi:FkbM family methyltransferase